MTTTENQSGPVHCVYHGGCPDGFAAAMAVIARHGVENVVLHPRGYDGEPPPPFPEEGAQALYIVDFSFPPDQLLATAEEWKGAPVTMLDHHATAKDQWMSLATARDGVDRLRFRDADLGLLVEIDMGRSGAGMAWDFIAPEEGRPLLVNYVEDQDLWSWRLPRSREVGAYILTIPHTAEAWGKALWLSDEALWSRGAGAAAFGEKLVAEVASRARLCAMNGELIWLSNSPYIAGSFAAERIAEEKKVPMAGYYLINNYGEWQYGFRGPGSKELAEVFGGGGHPSSAGCRSKEQLHIDVHDLQA